MEAASKMVKSFATIRLPNEAETAALAVRLAAPLEAGDIILLEGELGAGKTSFARALIQALCGSGTEVPSPTFTLLQVYESRAFPIAHFDLYRLEQPEDILELGWYAALEGVALVEWPQRLGVLTPSNALTAAFSFEGEGRRVDFLGSNEWHIRLKTVLK